MALAYERVDDLDGALAALGDLGLSGLPLAGGTDLMPDLRAGRFTDVTLVDISGVDALRGIEVTHDHVHVGSLVTAAEVARSTEVEQVLPVLALAARSLGSPQIRARATIGGNVVNASPAADLVLALVVAGAEVETATRGGTRSLPVEDFMVGPGLTRLRPGELVTGFRVPIRPDARYGHAKVGLRRALACALVGVGVMVVRSTPDGPCDDVRIALGAVAPTCMRAREAEAALIGRELDEDTVIAAGAAAASACAPIDDVRASASYRRHLVAVHVARLLREACGGDGRGGDCGGGG